jgi:sialate O-acetylesterase
MAIINDTGEAKDIHPKNKKDPGERLALWALAKDYGKDLKVWSGPLYRAAQTRDGAIRVAFDQAGSGLKSRDGGPLKRFEIAGQDQAWHWADAKVDGTDGVLVSSPAVPKPVAVRYAWASNPEGANLVNSEGLPASVFRTDDWKDVEAVPVDPAAEALKAKRALGVKVREFAAKRDTLERGSEEWRTISNEIRKLNEQIQETAKP